MDMGARISTSQLYNQVGSLIFRATGVLHFSSSTSSKSTWALKKHGSSGFGSIDPMFRPFGTHGNDDFLPFTLRNQWTYESPILEKNATKKKNLNKKTPGLVAHGDK